MFNSSRGSDGYVYALHDVPRLSWPLTHSVMFFCRDDAKMLEMLDRIDATNAANAANAEEMVPVIVSMVIRRRKPKPEPHVGHPTPQVGHPTP